MLSKYLNILRRLKHRYLLKKSFINYLHKNNLFLKKGNDFIIHDNKSKHDIYLRKKGSDIDVFKQIFMDDEYKLLIQTIKAKEININIIVDLGANIGLSAIYFCNIFENSKIYAVEPDSQNFKQLRLNISNKKNIFTENVAIWSEKIDLIENLAKPFKGGEDWSKTFIPSDQFNNGTKIKGITIHELMTKYHLTTIDLLKIDIEGAERFIFDKKNNLSFLTQTKVIAIEIHDEFNKRTDIYNILKNYGFLLFETGELSVGINHNLCLTGKSINEHCN